MVYIGDKIEVAIELCEEEIARRENWLNTGDYTDRELPAIKNDIKVLEALKSDLKTLL